MSGWELVKLGDVLKRSEEWVEIRPNELYKEVTIRLWGKGVEQRRLVSGKDIAVSRRLRVRTGQFIFSRIDARNGALGIVPESLDGAIVTNDFPSFNIECERASPRYLAWLSRTQQFWDVCKASSEGTTNRIRLKEERFLAGAIQLPPIEEQQRIILRIEELAAKVEEVRRLREDVRVKLDAIGCSLFRKTTWPTIPVREAVRLKEPDVSVRPDKIYEFAGVYSFGRGVFKSVTRVGSSVSYPKLSRLRQGDLVYPKLMAWEGAIGVVPEDCCGRVVSTEFPVFEVDDTVVFPEVLDTYFRSPSTWPLLAEASAGTNVRRRRLHPERFLALRIPLPSPDVQRQIRMLSHRAREIRQVQEGSSRELNALLPSILDKAFRGEL